MTPLRRQLRSMLRVEPREGGFVATFKLSPDLAILRDHFRGAPILPGVCMVQLVLLSAVQAMNVPDLHLRHLKNAKILRPILPNDQVRIDGTFMPGSDGSSTIKATFTTDSGQRCAEFSLIAGAVGAELRVRPGISETDGRTQRSAPTEGVA